MWSTPGELGAAGIAEVDHRLQSPTLRKKVVCAHGTNGTRSHRVLLINGRPGVQRASWYAAGLGAGVEGRRAPEVVGVTHVGAGGWVGRMARSRTAVLAALMPKALPPICSLPQLLHPLERRSSLEQPRRCVHMLQRCRWGEAWWRFGWPRRWHLPWWSRDDLLQIR